jgi:hypothetical protein
LIGENTTPAFCAPMKQNTYSGVLNSEAITTSRAGQRPPPGMPLHRGHETGQIVELGGEFACELFHEPCAVRQTPCRNGQPMRLSVRADRCA